MPPRRAAAYLIHMHPIRCQSCLILSLSCWNTCRLMLGKVPTTKKEQRNVSILKVFCFILSLFINYFIEYFVTSVEVLIFLSQWRWKFNGGPFHYLPLQWMWECHTSVTVSDFWFSTHALILGLNGRVPRPISSLSCRVDHPFMNNLMSNREFFRCLTSSVVQLN